ncbi:MAG TPA: ATP-binding protein [Elusimicrobiota bacterium]|nr:ATP-binding protein [Elusimicrobiota bacterium]
MGYLRRIREGSVLMGRLIDDLLKLSRVSRATLARERVDLSEMAELIFAELRRAEPERLVDVVVAPKLVVQGDAAILRILLENLLGNAWKYTRRKPTRAHIELGSAVSAGERVFFVRDDGAGFDMRYAGNLFKPFNRLHKAGEFEGTGIGLATVHRIVGRYGGRVWGEAKVGEGAVFYFTLPGAKP